MAYKYAPVKKSHKKLLDHLLDDVFEIQNTDKAALSLWKYYHPFFDGKTFQYGAFIGRDEEEKMVSHYANIPIEIIQDGDIYKASACVDMATHSLHRGQGLISDLSKLVYQDVIKSGALLSIGFSNVAGIKVDKYSKNYGYHIVGKFQSYYHILTKQQKTPIQLIKTVNFENIIIKNNYFSIHKTFEYLNWRYRDNPNNSYILYKIYYDEKFIGFVILKNSKIRTHVIDIISKDCSIAAMKNILKAINNIALKSNRRFTTFSVLDNKYWNEVFNKTLSVKKNLKKSTFYLTVKLHDPTLDINSTIYDKDNWMCFAGDIL